MSEHTADHATLGRVIEDMFEALGVTDNEAALVEIDRLKALRASAPARLTADPAPFLGVEAKMPKYEYQKDSSQGGVGAFSGCGEYRPVTVSCSTVIPKPSTAICAVSPPSPDTVREKDRADLAEKHLNQIYDYLGCCRSGSAVICTIKEREAALSSAPTPSAASTDKPAAIDYRGIALAAHNRATPVAPDASTPVQRPHE